MNPEALCQRSSLGPTRGASAAIGRNTRLATLHAPASSITSAAQFARACRFLLGQARPQGMSRDQSGEVAQIQSKAGQPNWLTRFELPLQGSNLDSSDPESDVLPVTPRGRKPPAFTGETNYTRRGWAINPCEEGEECSGLAGGRSGERRLEWGGLDSPHSSLHSSLLPNPCTLPPPSPR